MRYLEMAGNKDEGCAISISHIVDGILVPAVCFVENLASFARRTSPVLMAILLTEENLIVFIGTNPSHLLLK